MLIINVDNAWTTIQTQTTAKLKPDTGAVPGHRNSFIFIEIQYYFLWKMERLKNY